MTQVRRSDLCSGRLEGLFCTGVAVESSQQTATGALCIAKALRSRGVQHVFGMPGGVLLPLVEAIRAEGIALVLVRHEASAGFMADASYQLTGAPGVALSTLGPGMTNLVSGAAGALLERSRVLLLTGQVATELLGLYTHQILDQVALLRPVVKYGVQLRPGEVGNQLVTALAKLDEGRAGPVHLDLPADALAAPASNQVLSSMVPGSPVIPSVGHSDVLLAKTYLEASKRPILAVGCGDLSDHASQAVVQLAKKIGMPVLTTYRAKGMVPEGLGWSAGAFGLSPVVDAAQQELLARSDLLLAVGLDPVELRSNWLPGWPDTLPMISIDPFGQPELQHPTLLDLTGAIPDVLGPLASADRASEWTLSEVEDHRKKLDDIFADGPRGPASAVRAVQRACPANVLLSLDVGAHRITASHVWRASAPRSVIQSNGFSSMGTGLPGAIAARFAFPNRPVVALTGDMGLWMSVGELGVCQDHDLDMVVVVFNDRSLSLIDLKQERGGYPREFVSFSNPNVPTLARAFGGTGVRVQGQGQLGIAVRQAVSSGGLWLIEVDIDPIHYRQQM